MVCIHSANQDWQIINLLRSIMPYSKISLFVVLIIAIKASEVHAFFMAALAVSYAQVITAREALEKIA